MGGLFQLEADTSLVRSVTWRYRVVEAYWGDGSSEPTGAEPAPP